MNLFKSNIICFLSFFLFLSCSENKNTLLDEKIVRVHISNDPESLNPQCYRSALSGHIIKHLYQKLLSLDPKTNELVPVLANAQPVSEVFENGQLKLNLEIRKEAKWDNGKDITAEDVAFSVKLIKMPWVKNEHFKPYFEKVEKVIYNQETPKKLSILFKEAYIQAKWCLPDLFILPSHIIDPDGVINKQSFENIMSGSFGEDSMAAMNVAMRFSSDDFQRNGEFVKGSGAYRLKEWYSGNRIILERKESWWGDKINNENVYFEAHPSKIIYEHIKSWAQVIVSIKKGLLDVVSKLPTKDFLKLKDAESFNQNYITSVSGRNAYEYLGFNLKQEYLKDVKIREAIASITNTEAIINNVLLGMGASIKSPYFAVKDLYNDKLESRSYDPQHAQSLFKSAGWSDTNNDGVLDKNINGKRKPLKLKLIYNVENGRRENVGQVIKEEARKVGIDLELVGMEWSVYLEALRNRNFDMFIGGLKTSPQPPDPKQIWHTESYYNNGSNVFGFGNAKTDKLIEQIRLCMDKAEMKDKMYQLQEEIHNVIPCIFLYSLKSKIVIHNRFKDANIYSSDPGYWEGELKVSL